jgi:hypothetical protein
MHQAFFVLFFTGKPRKPRRLIMTAEDADQKYYRGADGAVALQCDKCLGTLGSLKEWATHQLIEHQIQAGDWLERRLGSGKLGPRCLPCPVCWKPFQVGNLPGHMAVHTKNFPFVCTQCGKGYAVNQYLTSHIQREHEGGLPKNFLCLLCGSAFTSKCMLVNLKLVLNEKTIAYTCIPSYNHLLELVKIRLI